MPYCHLLPEVCRDANKTWLKFFLFLSILFFSMTAIHNKGFASEWKTVIDSEDSSKQPFAAGREAEVLSWEKNKLDGRESVGNLPQPSLSPSQVIQRFLEAQVRGDLDEMFSEVAMELFSAKAQQAAIKAFGAIRDTCRMSELDYKLRSTCYNAEKTVAVVRYQTAVSIATSKETLQAPNGSLALLRKIDKCWKIVLMEPDNFLNMEIFQREKAMQTAPLNRQPDNSEQDFIDWSKLNQHFDKQIERVVLDDEGTLWDTIFSGIGAVPVVGDTISATYTGGKILLVLLPDLVNDCIENDPGFVMLDVAQIIMGGFCIIMEIAPGFDHLFDAVESAIDNLKYNRRQHRNFVMITSLVRHKKLARLKKFYFFLRPETIHAHPLNGIVNVSISHYSDWHGPMKPLRKIAFESDRPLRFWQKLRFYIGTELEIKHSESEVLFNAALALRVKSKIINNWTWLDKVVYIPLRICPTKNIPIHVSGTKVLENRQIQIEKKELSEACLEFDITGNPGPNQVFKISYGEGKSHPLEIENCVYNNLKGANAFNLQKQALGDKIKLEEGEAKTVVMLGDTVSLPEPHILDLPGHEWKIPDPDICRLKFVGHFPDATLWLKGLKKGKTKLEYKIKTGNQSGVQFIDGTKSILITAKKPGAGTWTTGGDGALSIRLKSELRSPGTIFCTFKGRTDYRAKYYILDLELKNTGSEIVRPSRVEGTISQCNGSLRHSNFGSNWQSLKPGEHLILKTPIIYLAEKENFRGTLKYIVHGVTEPSRKPVKVEFKWEKQDAENSH